MPLRSEFSDFASVRYRRKLAICHRNAIPGVIARRAWMKRMGNQSDRAAHS
jgi:hypothetical protein